MRLPDQDSSTGRAVKTAIQAVGGFIIGLIVVVWGVPGVPEAVIEYVRNNVFQIMITLGLPTIIGSGGLSFVWNMLRKNIPNY